LSHCLTYISLRIFVSDEKGKFDELVEEKGVRILVEPKALMHVIGTKMDFVDDKLRFGPLSHFKRKVTCRFLKPY